jgi:hypothetical protein
MDRGHQMYLLVFSLTMALVGAFGLFAARRERRERERKL